jgi:hypothetical protein
MESLYGARTEPRLQKVDYDGVDLYKTTMEIVFQRETENEHRIVQTLYFDSGLFPSALVGQGYDETGEWVSSYIHITLRVHGSSNLWDTLKDCYEAGKVYFTRVYFADLYTELEDSFDVQTADEIFYKLGM